MTGPVVLTAFEPFGAWETNSTIAVVTAAAQRLRDAGLLVRTRVLPVDLEGAMPALEQALAGDRPAAVICCGLSGRARTVHVERVALNVADFRIPDAGGRTPRGEFVVPGAPEAYLTPVPVHSIVAALAERGVPSQVSNSAGTYLCNAVYFCALRATRSTGVPTLFLHLPPLPGAAAEACIRDPSAADPEAAMSVELQVEAVVAVAEFLIPGHPDAEC